MGHTKLQISYRPSLTKRLKINDRGLKRAQVLLHSTSSDTRNAARDFANNRDKVCRSVMKSTIILFSGHNIN